MKNIFMKISLKVKQRFLFLLCGLVLIFSCQSEVHFASLKSSAQQKSKSKPPVMEEKPEPPVVEAEPEPPPVEEKPKLKEYEVTLKAKQKRKLDLLLVLDTSASMDHHLEKLGGRVFSLLDSISDYDWQIAFITADHGDHELTQKENKEKVSSFAEDKWEDHIKDPQFSFGKLLPLEAEPVQLAGEKSWRFNILDQKILKPETPNYKNIFLNTVSHFPEKLCEQPPFCQKPMEQPLRSLKSAMERINLDNTELFRPEADFVSLIISNERERLEDTRRATSAEEVIDTFNRLLKPLEKRFFAFNILVLDKECQKSEKERGGAKALTASLGLENIGRLADLTGGENISICLEDYAQALQKISRVIEVFVEQSIDIEDDFAPETLQLEFLNSEPLSWELAGHRLIFKEEPSKDIQIKISYLPLSNEKP